MPSESRDASGGMELRYRWSETNSGYTERSETVRLEGKGAVIQLVVKESELKVGKGGASTSTARFDIGVDELVKFIEKNGKRTY